MRKEEIYYQDKYAGLLTETVDGVFNRFLKNRSKANHLIKHSFLSIEMQNRYLSLMETRYQTIYPEER